VDAGDRDHLAIGQRRAASAALAYSEMVSGRRHPLRRLRRTWKLVEPGDTEPDIAGSASLAPSLEQFSEAVAAICARLGSRLVLIDVNMACPVPKVVRKGEGSALLDTPELACANRRTCVTEATVPVTVEDPTRADMRARGGARFRRAPWSRQGPPQVAVHGRFGAQLYRGEADWACGAARGKGRGGARDRVGRRFQDQRRPRECSARRGLRP